MQFAFATDLRAKLTPALAADAAAIARVGGNTVEEATNRLKEKGRAQIRVAFPSSRRLPNQLRGDYFAAKAGKPPTGYVYTKWMKRGRDVFDVFVGGLTVRSRAGKFMLVPLDRARAKEARRALKEFKAGGNTRYALIKTLGGKLLLVERALAGTRQKRSKLIGVLTRQVKEPKRLDFRPLREAAPKVLDERLDANLKSAGL